MTRCKTVCEGASAYYVRVSESNLSPEERNDFKRMLEQAKKARGGSEQTTTISGEGRSFNVDYYASGGKGLNYGAWDPSTNAELRYDSRTGKVEFTADCSSTELATESVGKNIRGLYKGDFLKDRLGLGDIALEMGGKIYIYRQVSCTEREAEEFIEGVIRSEPPPPEPERERKAPLPEKKEKEEPEPKEPEEPAPSGKLYLKDRIVATPVRTLTGIVANRDQRGGSAGLLGLETGGPGFCVGKCSKGFAYRTGHKGIIMALLRARLDFVFPFDQLPNEENPTMLIYFGATLSAISYKGWELGATLFTQVDPLPFNNLWGGPYAEGPLRIWKTFPYFSIRTEAIWNATRDDEGVPVPKPSDVPEFRVLLTGLF